MGVSRMSEKEYKQKAELMFERNTILINQLEKAKELLKQWVQTSYSNGCDNVNILSDTQDFLKE